MNVARVGDMTTGHDTHRAQPAIVGSSNVFVNNQPIQRVFDVWQSHSNTHESKLIQGSTTVFANGLSIGRIGDALNCGETIATGSETVFSG